MSWRALNRLLVVEDNPGDVRLLREMVNEGGSPDTQLTHVISLQEAESYLTNRAVDLILLDLGLPDAQGLGAVRRAKAAAPRVPLVVLTGLDDELLAVQSLREGAQDYLIKGQIETRGLLRALRYAVERKLMEEVLFVEKERAQVTLSCIGDGVACTDLSGRVTLLNAVAENMTGWAQQEALGRPLAEVCQIVDATTREAIPDLTGTKGAPPVPGHLPPNCVLLRRDGSEIPIEDSVAPIHDREGHHIGAVIVLRDVSAGRAMAQQIIHSAQHDVLTGLPNRMLLHDRVNRAIAWSVRHAKKGALLFLDLDGFKQINDSLGHPVGDRLLQSIGRRLVGCLRGSDTVSRQGGDEFVVLLSEIEHSEDAAISARRMLEAVSQPHAIDGRELHITTCIGVSVYPDDGQDAETLIKNADTAMYQAKDNGRHRYQFFESGMNGRAVERQSIEEGLRQALARQEVSLHYQPKINLTTGAITGAEALVRWTHPTRGPIAPAQFIPVAEDCGLMLSVGNWVLREACRQTRAWADAGLPPITVAVNVSAVELRAEHFVAGVFAILAETGLDPRALELELTESVLMTQIHPTEGVLKALRARGVQVAIDDFGTGHSSLSYLRRLSIDALKIDQSFVRQITAVPQETTIVAAVIGMGRNLKLRVVAEGVETEEQLAFLRTQQCDEAQGYYFSRPVLAQEFAKLLETGIATPTFANGEPNRLDCQVGLPVEPSLPVPG